MWLIGPGSSERASRVVAGVRHLAVGRGRLLLGGRERDGVFMCVAV